MIITRVKHHRDGPFSGKDEIFEPARRKQTPHKGLYQLAIKKTPHPINHAENQVFVETIEEVAALVRKGHSLWMRGNLTGQRNLITPPQIDITP